MDQAKSQNQIVSGDIKKRRLVPDMDCHDFLFTSSLHQIPNKVQRFFTRADTHGTRDAHDAKTDYRSSFLEYTHTTKIETA